MIGASINKLVLGSGSYKASKEAGEREIELIDEAIKELFKITDSLARTGRVKKMPKKEINEAVRWLKEARRRLYLGKKESR